VPLAAVTWSVYEPVTVGVKLYTFSAPGVVNPQEFGLQPAPLPVKLTLLGLPQVMVSIGAAQGSTGGDMQSI
jgi:hypothetical protein